MPKSDFELLNKFVSVSHGTFERLEIYKNLLLKWQSSINLISPSTISDAWSRHFIDSIQLCRYIDSPKKRIIDLGTGAGFPGLVLSIVTNHEIHLVESDKKKCIFLREVSRETNANVIIHNDRIETISIPDVDIITSRACADVSQLLVWSEKIVSHGTKCLFHKGKNYSMELQDAKKEWQFHEKIHESVIEKDSVVLELSSIRRRHEQNSNTKKPGEPQPA